ncbi:MULTISPECIES: hypothetical protein [Pseudomonas]|uniref:Uncharacterized protein n=1 Tax=Pseudomonas phytophila TaxID=2867264 RepID=A0ABY6FFE4_9PSED|nr:MULTISPECIES: hypothetical protein [Pseudomonas]MCD5988728.1 hypothetical protein [Pseudomonas quasicaspiana]MDU8358641.1 hypothetical protein [Pseudomonas syringae group sp. J309-1]UXZ96626.1 hypothetical protein K3169_01550 [Pseudomonas phytophila]
MLLTDFLHPVISIGCRRTAALSTREARFGREDEVGDNFVCVVGMKADCSDCDKTFLPSKEQQKTLFIRQPLACPHCRCMLISPQEQLDALGDKGNPGMSYIPTMIIMGICNMVFFGMVIAGIIDQEAVILLGFAVAIFGLMIVSFGFRSATRDLKIRLEKYDSP